MASETVEFILTAKDNASSVFRQTKEELEILEHQAKNVGKEGEKAGKVIANVFDVAGFKGVADAIRNFSSLHKQITTVVGSLKNLGLLSKSLPVAAAVATAYASFKAGSFIFDKFIYDTKEAKKAHAEQMEFSKKLFKDLEDVALKSFQGQIKEAFRLPSLKETEKELINLQEIAKKDLASNQKSKEAAEARLKAIEGEWFSMFRGYGRAAEAARDVEQAETQINIAANKNKTLQEQIIKLRTDQAEKARQERDAATDSVNKTAQSYEEQIKYLGLVGRELEIQKILNSDASQEAKNRAIRAVDAFFDQKKVTDDLEKQNKENEARNDLFKSMTDNLNEQLATLGKSEEEINIMKILQSDLTKEQKDFLVDLEKTFQLEKQLIRDKEKERDLAKQITKEKEKENEQIAKSLEKDVEKSREELQKIIERRDGLSLGGVQSADSRFLRQGTGLDLPNRQLNISKQQLDVLAAQRELTIKIERHLDFLQRNAQSANDGGGLSI